MTTVAVYCNKYSYAISLVVNKKVKSHTNVMNKQHRTSEIYTDRERHI